MDASDSASASRDHENDIMDVPATERFLEIGRWRNKQSIDYVGNHRAIRLMLSDIDWLMGEIQRLSDVVKGWRQFAEHVDRLLELQKKENADGR